MNAGECGCLELKAALGALVDNLTVKGTAAVDTFREPGEAEQVAAGGAPAHVMFTVPVKPAIGVS